MVDSSHSLASALQGIKKKNCKAPTKYEINDISLSAQVTQDTKQVCVFHTASEVTQITNGPNANSTVARVMSREMRSN